MRTSVLLATAALVVLLAAPAQADGRRPGSVLVFPTHRSPNPVFMTCLAVTNTDINPVDPSTGSLGGSTTLRFQYMNVRPDPTDPFNPLSCQTFSRFEALSPGDHLAVATQCHNATPLTVQEGYVVVTAQDPQQFNRPWSHNHLVGSQLVVTWTGAMYSVNAVPYSSPIPKGTHTDVNVNGLLDFDGVEYEGTPDKLYIDSFIGMGAAHLSLINLTGGVFEENSITMSIFNDNEFPVSATFAFRCYFNAPLWDISPVFTESFLLSLPHDPAELDLLCDGQGNLETGWVIIDSVAVKEPGGSLISNDGAFLGVLSCGRFSPIHGGRLLWESAQKQNNGIFLTP